MARSMNNIKNYLQLFYLLYTIGNVFAIPAQKNITGSFDINKYILQYRLDLQKDTFVGVVDIEFKVKKGNTIGTTLVLDSEDLKVTDVSLLFGKSVLTLPFIHNDYNVTLNLPKPLIAGTSYTLSLNFIGSIASGNGGINKYSAHGHKYVSTNFFPFNARKAFPCFNDPLIKSIFSLRIAISGEKDAVPLSNMPYEYHNEDMTLYQFKDTPKMPLYSLFFAVGFYEVLENMNNVYVSNKNAINFNIELKKVLGNDEFNKFLNLANLTSVTIVSVPGLQQSYVTGYGIVAISEDILFTDMVKTTTEQRKLSLLEMFGAVYKVFYGNLLAPKTWSDVWLIESIPIYLKYNGLTKLNEWGDPNDFINYDIQDKVLHQNSHPNSRAVVDKSIKTEDDVLNLIEGVTMLKGAGVLTMMESVLSRELLVSVIMKYFVQGLAVTGGDISTEDFIQFLGNDKDVINKLTNNSTFNEVIQTWLYQAGYPYIQTRRSGSVIEVDEKEFLSGPLKQVTKLWKFPLFYSIGNNSDFIKNTNYFWLLPNSNRTVAFNFTLTKDKWFIINVNGTGPYRVNYEDKDWNILAGALKEQYDIFPASTRAKLISDAFAMLYAGHASYKVIFDFLIYLQNEQSLTPWLSALQGFEHLGTLLYRTDLKNDFIMYMNKLLHNIYYKLGIDKVDSDKQTNILRQKIVSAMCQYEDGDCLSKTINDYNKMQNHEAVNIGVDIRPVIICNGIRTQNSKNEWQALYNEIFDNTLIMGKDVRKIYFDALTCPLGNEASFNYGIEGFLELIFMNSDTIQSVDIPAAFKAVYTKPDHTSHALDYYLVHENKFRNDITLREKVSMLNSITPYLTTENEYKLLQDYVNKTKPIKEMKDAATNAMQFLMNTRAYLTKHNAEIRAALESLDPPPSSPTATASITTLTPSIITDPTTQPPVTHPTGSDTTSTGNSSIPTTTHKPNSSANISMFSLSVLTLFYFALRLIT